MSAHLGRLLTVAVLCTVTGARAQETGSATISGKVLFKGDPIPKQKLEDINREPRCAPAEGKFRTQAEIVNAKNRGIANVFVRIAVAPAGAKFKAEHAPHVVEQKG